MMSSRSNNYQIALIILGAVATALFAIFVYRELFPEYRIYQNDYVVLEEFRSSYTNKAPPEFKPGVKQILINVPDNGPPIIDRCTSCHVALDIPYFSPTKITHDANGKAVVDENGIPVKVPNEDYIWAKLDQRIAELKDDKEVAKLKALKTVEVDGQVYDVSKALTMHPLMGKETRPFEFHPVGDYGCTVCHGGNGRALTTDKAHGPVFDGQYDTEGGHERKFLESDENDPLISKMFNSKPGDKLVFQTTPILIGELMQSKCMQCHKSGEQKALDELTETYHQGAQLFIEQACYACHRISGYSRGGVGPELTLIGKNYPWYIKRHIVWPQGDLPTSTMPNYHLDHEELGALMTFLLGQRGQNDAISKVDYVKSVSDWEKNKKMAWEKPVTPVEIYDLNHSMTIFATQGCAACHRLKGFESDVGYRVEKDNKGKVDFDSLYREREWFTKMFPEELLGSEIVKALDKNTTIIDQHIVDGVRENSLLEAIEKQYPGDIESFYSNFKFAARAKDQFFADQLSQAKNPADKKKIEEEFLAYKKRVHRVLMIYVQEYGLGRLVGPRPNWSGIYRTDAWLMEHFKKPNAHVARSIMPVFPFDDTKFYALTHMLDVLGKKNRDWDRQLWEKRGFNPSVAYQLYCSQCHGEYLGGNGPVAEWIYPIPKNLRNADFLRNYTKERVNNSITHGVQGTPMAPWGQVAEGKPAITDNLPVLTKHQVEQLTEWLFSTLPGSTYIQVDVTPKWNYQPSDAIKEMEEEGDKLESTSPPKKEVSLALKDLLPNGNAYIVAVEPAIPNTSLEVSEYFDVVPQGKSALDQNAYYIKKKFYAEENLAKGQAFFNLYCATCHGAEADGMGARAEAMQESKPRMLTNLDWLHAHDDLYLLRSIKFGVPGTSMTPWGDQTTSLLRMQLVMYIRSLSVDATAQKKLDEALYSAFSPINFKIDAARVQGFNQLLATEKLLLAEQAQLKMLSQDPAKQEDATKSYKQTLELEEKVKKEKEHDAEALKLKESLDQEAKIYKSLGVTLLAGKMDPSILDALLQLLALNESRYSLKDGQLQVSGSEVIDQKMANIQKQMVASVDLGLKEANSRLQSVQSKMNSAARDKQIQEIEAEIKSLNSFKDKLTTDFQETSNLHKSQLEIIKRYNGN